MFVSSECCVVSGGSFCDGLITRPEESYRARARVCVCVCVSLSVIRCNNNSLYLRLVRCHYYVSKKVSQLNLLYFAYFPKYVRIAQYDCLMYFRDVVLSMNVAQAFSEWF